MNDSSLCSKFCWKIRSLKECAKIRNIFENITIESVLYLNERERKNVSKNEKIEHRELSSIRPCVNFEFVRVFFHWLVLKWIKNFEHRSNVFSCDNASHLNLRCSVTEVTCGFENDVWNVDVCFVLFFFHWNWDQEKGEPKKKSATSLRCVNK